MFTLISVLTLCFCPKLFLFCNIRQRCLPCCSCNKNQNCHTLFRMKLTIKQDSPQTTIKQARFYKPSIYDKQLGFNKPAVVIRDSLFAVFRHLCFNGCLRDMRHPFKVGLRNKHTANRRRSPIKSTYRKLLFLRSDNAKLFVRKQPE